jgi:carbonic anhydrase
VTLRDDILSANERYASTFALGDLPREPRRRVAVVTCMDARIDPLAILGLRLGDAHVLRNAGGVVTDDVLRSLAISHAVLGAEEAVVVGHTGCGMQGATNAELRALVGAPPDVDFLPFADLEERVRESVRTILESELLPDRFAASGWVYDVSSGRLREVSI